MAQEAPPLEIDQAGDFPQWVTDEMKKGNGDPLVKAYQTLPEPHKTRAKRKLETFLNETLLEMNEDEKIEWTKKRSRPLQFIIVRLPEHKWGHHWNFDSVESAARAMVEWYNQMLAPHEKTLKCVIKDSPESRPLKLPITYDDFIDMILSEDTLHVEYRGKETVEWCTDHGMDFSFEVLHWDESLRQETLYTMSYLKKDKESDDEHIDNIKRLCRQEEMRTQCNDEYIERVYKSEEEE